MSTILLNLKRSFISPVPVPDFGFPGLPYALSPPALQEFGITIVSLKYHQSSLAIPPKLNYKQRKP